MAGKVRTREKCPECGNKFQIVEDVKIFCPQCNRIPATYFIFIYWQGEKHRISRDPDGHILDSYRRAIRLLEKMREEIGGRRFNISNYVRADIEQFRGHALLKKWQEIKESENLSGWYMYKVREYLKNHFRPFFEKRDLRTLTAGNIEDFFTQLPPHLSDKTKKNIMDMLKTFCKWLYKREVINRVPAFPVISPAAPVIKWISKDNQMLILNYIPEEHRPVFEFLMYHPLRISEALALKIKDFNREDGYISISQSFGFKGELKTRKNKKPYFLPISRHFDWQLLKGKFPETFVFTHKGKTYNVNGIGDIWRAAFEKAKTDGINLEYINPYNATRHSIASQAINAGISLERVSKALGHEQLETTRKKYASMSTEILRDIVDGVDVHHLCTKKTNVSD